MIPCICIDDKNKPDEIPLKNWIQEGFTYHITHVFCMRNWNNIQGCNLAEVKIPPECYPYEVYKLSRFGITFDNLEKLRQLMRDCTELDDVNIDKLIEESNLQLIENE